MSNENKLSTAPAGAVAQKTAGGGALSVFADGASFNTALRMAQCLASSTVVPKEYHGNVGNCMIAIEMASRINTSPMMVMQNLYIVNGRPAWSSQWIIAMINSSRRYKTELQFEFGRDKADGGLSCRAWAEDYSGHKVYGPKITMNMANEEGWTSKNGSKWKTMPDVMIQYRAASFFGRMNCPDMRYMIRRDEVVYWADTREELWERFNLTTPEEKNEPKSVTFIMSSVYDNQELLRIDPGYLSNLKALSVIQRERLLKGNWKIRAAAGLFFKRTQLGEILTIMPQDVIQWVRCWDLAATEKTENGDPAYTAGVLMGKRKNGRYVIADVINKQMNASDVRKTIKLTAQADRAAYKRVRIRLPKDPGQAGKEQAESYIKFLSGFDVTAVAESGSKEARAEPMAAQWQAGNFDIMYSEWNEMYLTQLENFPDGKFKDMVDASANAFAEIETKTAFNVGNLI